MTRNRIIAIVAALLLLGAGIIWGLNMRQITMADAAGGPTAAPTVQTPGYMLQPTIDAQQARIKELEAALKAAQEACPAATQVAVQPTSTVLPANTQAPTANAVVPAATQVPTANAVVPQTAACPPEWTGGWSKEDDFPTEGNRLGSASYWTVFQGWKAPDTKTTVQIIVAPGMQIVLPQGWTGTIWHTCQRFDARWQEMVQELKVNNQLDFVPPVIVIDSSTTNAVLPDGVSVAPFKADGAIVDPTLSDPFAEERFIVAEEATTLLGDAQMWTYVKIAYPDNRSDLGVSVLIAPGYAVRYPAGWQGIKQHLSGAPDLANMSYDLILDLSLIHI